ncbi:MAG: hypothetical protein OXG79_03960 [Chloroflexi bacterium]|nr:hypothetical protein [Chloroflexota bacterium]
MPDDQASQSFSRMITQQLPPETRELWAAMADYFDRDGPEAVKNYLDAEKDRREGRVRSQLEQFEGS